MSADSQESQPVGSTEQQRFISFLVDEEEYAVPILRVQEVRNAPRFTPVPRAPDYLLGVCSVRGAIVPVIELRRRFGRADRPSQSRPVAIVVSVESGERTRVMALMVDSLMSVHGVDGSRVKPAPELGVAQGFDFAAGMLQFDDSLITVIELDRLLNTGELAVLEEVLP